MTAMADWMAAQRLGWHGPHTCQRCLAEGQPAAWQHVLALGRPCPMPAVSDCLTHRLGDMPGRARKEVAA